MPTSSLGLTVLNASKKNQALLWKVIHCELLEGFTRHSRHRCIVGNLCSHVVYELDIFLLFKM